MIDEAKTDAIAFLRLLRRGEVNFLELRSDLLLSDSEVNRMDNLVLELPEAHRQIGHRREVWRQIVLQLLQEKRRAGRKNNPKQKSRRREIATLSSRKHAVAR